MFEQLVVYITFFTSFPSMQEASIPFPCYWKVKNLVLVSIKSP